MFDDADVAKYKYRHLCPAHRRPWCDLQVLLASPWLHELPSGVLGVLVDAICESELDFADQIVVRVLLRHRPEENRVTSSPYFAAIILASMVWVGWCWATKLVRGKLGLEMR